METNGIKTQTITQNNTYPYNTLKEESVNMEYTSIIQEQTKGIQELRMIAEDLCR